MSAPDDARAERERLVLEAALGEGLCRGAARARLEGHPDGARELWELEERLSQTRAELRELPDWSPRREQALVARILASTTRAAPRERRASGLVRTLPYAAAVLVAGLGAWAYLRSEPAPDSAPEHDSLAEPAADVRVADLRPEGGVRDVLTLAHEKLTRTAAAAGQEPRFGEIGPDAPLELRLLEARAKGLRERRWEPWLEEIPLADLGTLPLALWFEVQLDRYVLAGERPPAWKKALDILRHDLVLERELEAVRGDDGSARLLAHALERAGEYGLTDGGTPTRVARADSLWTGEWFSDLEAAGRAAGLADSGPWRAWVDWRGR